MKKCSKCGESKPLDQFHKNKCNKDGLGYECKPCITERVTLWRQANPDKHRKSVKKWTKGNPDKKKELLKRYELKHPEKIKLKRARYKARKLKATHELHSERVEKCFYKMIEILREETGKEFHLDHILPLNKGGSHWHLNMQIVLQSKNVTKQDSLAYQDEWLMHFTDLPKTVLDSIDPERLSEAYKEIEGIEIIPFQAFSLDPQD